MNTCKSCKYFDRQTQMNLHTQHIIVSKFGECNKAVEYYEDIFSDDENHPVDSIIFDGYSAMIIVGENFGCIHHEKKE